jgi:hypothetical protein
MSTTILDRPVIEETTPITDMPPLDVVKCRCDDSCFFDFPCPKEATEDDMLCDVCRRANKLMDQLRSGVFSATDMTDILKIMRSGLKHCHKCDPEFNGGEDGDGDNGNG